jgi:hypothetical protein
VRLGVRKCGLEKRPFSRDFPSIYDMRHLLSEALRGRRGEIRANDFTRKASMKNASLFEWIRKLVATERRIGIEILECLYEIECRKAYAELRYDGLFTYCVKELGFTDSQAYQRIQAMRALKELPELKAKIESGALSVSTVSKAQAHFRSERKIGRAAPKSEKLALFAVLENQTSREVDAKLAEVRGEAIAERLIVEMDGELAELWRRVKGLAAHRAGGGGDREVLRLLAREWLSRNDPARMPKRNRSRAGQSSAGQSSAGQSSAPAPGGNQRAVPSSTKVAPTRFIPAHTRREVWRRAGSLCEHCGSRHALEIDHRVPFALGGKSDLANLRLLCRSCNRFASVRIFGARQANAFPRRSTSAG